MRAWTGAAVGRLRQDWIGLLEATVAATLAWVVAARVIGHPSPFFAPSTALVVLSQSRGRRIRHSVEIVLGVAAGVLVGEVVARALGSGALTVAAVLAVTIGLMVLAGASGTLTVQAAISALYLVIAVSPKSPQVPFRFLDALIGGAVALAVSQVVLVRDPLAPLVTQARQTYADLAGVLDDIAAALRGCDETCARAVLDRARQVDGCVERLRSAVRACGEVLRLRIRARRHVDQVREVEETARHLDYAARNIRVLARSGVMLARLQHRTPPQVCAAIEALSAAVRAAGEAVVHDLAGSDAGGAARRADGAALDAVRTAGRLLDGDPPLPVAMIVGQIRATAVDLLRGVGEDDIEVLDRVDRALDLSPA